MSCRCGCHDDAPYKTAATGWRRFVPLIVGAAVVGALIGGTLLKKDGTTEPRRSVEAKQMGTATRP